MASGTSTEVINFNICNISFSKAITKFKKSLETGRYVAHVPDRYLCETAACLSDGFCLDRKKKQIIQ
jgi:hypothetical protein